MHDDDKYLIATAILLIFSLLFLATKKRKFVIANFIIFLLYMSMGLYKYFYDGLGGGAFVAWAFMLFLVSLQLLITITYILVLWIQKGIHKRKGEAKKE